MVGCLAWLLVLLLLRLLLVLCLLHLAYTWLAAPLVRLCACQDTVRVVCLTAVSMRRA